MSRKISYPIILFILILIAALSIILVSTSKSSLPSPISTKTSLKKITTVVGFMSYWNFFRLDKINFDHLTDVYFFDLAITKDGHINSLDPGAKWIRSDSFKKLQTIASSKNIRLGVTVSSHDNKTILALIKNSDSSKNLVADILDLKKSQNIKSINLDLEYSGNYDPDLTAKFSHFINSFSDQIHAQDSSFIVSFDAFADSFVRPKIFNLKDIVKNLDSIILMAYDFTQLDSIKAGPITPLHGQEAYKYDLATAITDFLKEVPSEKLTIALPLYGYDWPTQSNEKGSFVAKSPRSAEISSLRRSLQTASDQKTNIETDPLSNSPWFSYFDTGSNTWRQVWFENSDSLKTKCLYIRSSGLTGVGLFALGYESDDSNSLWSAFVNCFTSN